MGQWCVSYLITDLVKLTRITIIIPHYSNILVLLDPGKIILFNFLEFSARISFVLQKTHVALSWNFEHTETFCDMRLLWRDA